MGFQFFVFFYKSYQSHCVGQNRLVRVIDVTFVLKVSVKNVFDETPSINPKVENLRKNFKELKKN